MCIQELLGKLPANQVTSKLNYAQTGIYLMYLGAVLGSTGRISFLLTASFINRDILPADVSATPNLSLLEKYLSKPFLP